MLRTENGHEDQQDEKEGRAEQRQSPGPLARHHRDGDHHWNPECDPGELPPEIIEFGEADVAARIAMRGGGGRCSDGDQSNADQHREQQQQDLVDFPEPAADRARVGTAVAVGIDECCFLFDLAGDAADHNPSTTVRNWSPRSSKSLNWSKLAQAGERSTVSPASASPAAARTARSSVSHSATAMCGDKSLANNSPASPMV